jgi:hypothetical protein
MPDLCIQEGLDCASCTSSTARELARACPGLPGRLVAQLFVQIHTHSACVRMHANFGRAYADALDTDRMTVASERIEKKAPMGVRPPMVAAVAAA